jgi:hypothetical protein
MFVSRGLVTEADIERALERQRVTGLRLGETLFEMGLISSFDLASVLAARLGVPFVDLDDTEIDPRAVAKIPSAVARRAYAVPLSLEGNRLRVAIADPTNDEAVSDVEWACRLDVEPVLADPAQLLAVLQAVYPEDGDGFAFASRTYAEPSAPASPPPGPREAAAVASELRRLRLAGDLGRRLSAGMWSPDALELLGRAELLAVRNLVEFLTDHRAPAGAGAFTANWPPSEPVVSAAFRRLAKARRRIAADVSGPAASSPGGSPLDESDVDAIRADLDLVGRAFMRALPADHRAWFDPVRAGTVVDVATDPPATLSGPAREAPVGAEEVALVEWSPGDLFARFAHEN